MPRIDDQNCRDVLYAKRAASGVLILKNASSYPALAREADCHVEAFDPGRLLDVPDDSCPLQRRNPAEMPFRSISSVDEAHVHDGRDVPVYDLLLPTAILLSQSPDETPPCNLCMHLVKDLGVEEVRRWSKELKALSTAVLGSEPWLQSVDQSFLLRRGRTWNRGFDCKPRSSPTRLQQEENSDLRKFTAPL